MRVFPSIRSLSPLAARGLATLGLLLCVSSLRADDYRQPITFTVNKWETKHRNRDVQKMFLMLDAEGGRNPVYRAREMQANADRTVFTYSTELAEGRYFYVFVPDMHLIFPNLNDVQNNPDEVPEDDYFRDPHPRAPGTCGPFSTDSCLIIVNPARPVFDASSFAPAGGASQRADTVTIRVEVQPGDSPVALDPSSAQIEVELDEPQGVFYRADPFTARRGWQTLSPVTSTDLGGGRLRLEARWTNPGEGLHRVRVRVADQSGLSSLPFVSYVHVNRDNQAPVAKAGPTAYGLVNQPILVDGGGSYDPDQIGITAYRWRVLDGPSGANTQFWYINEEGWEADATCSGAPVVSLSDSPTPRFVTDRSGTYTLGLTLVDDGGLQSAESQVRVRVYDSFDSSVRTRLLFDQEGNEFVIDASLSTGASSAQFWPDPSNPGALVLTSEGLVARGSVPADGVYLVTVQVGGAVPHTALLKIEGGRVEGVDLAKPARAFWEREAAIYLAYIREFVDSDGDGEGDLPGMTQRLDHLVELGVNALWLMPPLPGPTPHGYGMTAHFDVEPDYGDLADYEALVRAAHQRGIRVIFDFVGNHSITEHPFFNLATQDPASPWRDYYSWQPDGQFHHLGEYLSFPDLNSNSVLVRKLFTDQVRFWVERGVDAFRYDLANCQPSSLWQLMRREIKGLRPGAVIIPESHPPKPRMFDRACDMAYDSEGYEGFLHALAIQDWPLSAFDAYLRRDAHNYVSRDPWLSQFMQDGDVMLMRYFGNQDKHRFLKQANYNMNRLRVAWSALLTLPGTPLIYYGDETGVVVKRGRMKLDNLDSDEQALWVLSRRLLRLRQRNAALAAPDYAPWGSAGNSYLRINSDADPGGNDGFAYLRYGEGQRFLIIAYRANAGPLGTSVKLWPPTAALANFADGELVLVDHLDPGRPQRVTKAQLLASTGFAQRLRSYQVKVLQVTRFGIPDGDGDGVLDSEDFCLGLADPEQRDMDRDGVGDACDACANTAVGQAVNTRGCPVSAGEARARYLLDGAIDDQVYAQVSSANKLYASFNGRELYVATEAANLGEDVCVVVTRDSGATRTAPYGKAGRVAFSGIALCDRGADDQALWIGTTGQSRAASRARRGKGVIEGTLNLLEEFGEIPAQLSLAALRYEGAPAGSLQSQTPAAMQADGDVQARELFVMPLHASAPDAGALDSTGSRDAAPPDTSPFDAGSADRGGLIDAGRIVDASAPDAAASDTFLGAHDDADRDGVQNIEDNCPRTANAGQEDYDLDGVGDLCDACPVSMPGAQVDAQGCAVEHPVSEGARGTRPEPRPAQTEPARPEPQREDCQCRGEGGPQTVLFAASMLAALLWRRRSR